MLCKVTLLMGVCEKHVQDHLILFSFSLFSTSAIYEISERFFSRLIKVSFGSS